jgi:hypothetical protein
MVLILRPVLRPASDPAVDGDFSRAEDEDDQRCDQEWEGSLLDEERWIRDEVKVAEDMIMIQADCGNHRDDEGDRRQAARKADEEEGAAD